MTDTTLHSFALGLATLDSQQKIIEVYYPQPLLNPDSTLIKKLSLHCGYQVGNAAIVLSDEQRKRIAEDNTLQIDAELVNAIKHGKSAVVATFLAENTVPASVAEVYLKLHLLSHRLCKPHSLNLQGAFGILRNIAWTNLGAIAIEELASRQLAARAQGHILDVMSVDKFPKMVNYIVPSGVRIADTARVRLGAYVGEGTTVMHEGFINFNAGTEGSAMIEGRISAGVVVGEGSDLGGGCSTMGTLSGGGTAIISVGRDCLIGANAGIGIALGDRCIVEAGLYVTGGTKVAVLDNEGNLVQHIKAKELSGRNDLLFRRNSQTGAVECKTNKTSIALNEELHSHN
ncbi:MAG: 2,3,4,5-tetrahydropyridine-2,6-dicarboxylate N-succinyltransferase [Gammaproteobacteria bacterium]|nr:2,3,4,5-tetrahydropyridine-2,6-dicarboxylate N-succinyltransferase [Gammaproteobacteria bacterium]